MPTYAIKSVGHALQAIHMVRDDAPVRIADVSRRLVIAPSTAHRIMSMLLYEGFAIKDEQHRYLPGPALSAPVIATPEGRLLVSVAMPVMERLSRQLGESVNLTIRVGAHARVLATAEARTLLRIGDRTGSVLPAHATAAGRALLAAEPVERVESLLRDTRVPGSRHFGDGEYDEFLRELSRTRLRGYALCREEAQRGVAALAVTVSGGRPQPVATLAVVTPESRLDALYLTPDKMGSIRSAQQELSEQLARALSRQSTSARETASHVS